MSRGTINRTAKGENLTGRCDVCNNSNIERLGRCMGCMKGKRPEKDEAVVKILRTANNHGLNLEGKKQGKELA